MIITAALTYGPLNRWFRGLFLNHKGENMGFLSVYDGTRKVIIDEERDYWVEISEYVSQGAKEDAERCISKVVMVDGNAVPTPDITRYRAQMLVASIKTWNLDDEDGRIWPVDLKHVQMLPGSIFDTLWKEVDNKGKERTPQDERQFPVEDLGGDSDGDGGATEPFDVPSA